MAWVVLKIHFALENIRKPCYRSKSYISASRQANCSWYDLKGLSTSVIQRRDLSHIQTHGIGGIICPEDRIKLLPPIPDATNRAC